MSLIPYSSSPSLFNTVRAIASVVRSANTAVSLGRRARSAFDSLLVDDRPQALQRTAPTSAYSSMRYGRRSRRRFSRRPRRRFARKSRRVSKKTFRARRRYRGDRLRRRRVFIRTICDTIRANNTGANSVVYYQDNTTTAWVGLNASIDNTNKLVDSIGTTAPFNARAYAFCFSTQQLAQDTAVVNAFDINHYFVLYEYVRICKIKLKLTPQYDNRYVNTSTAEVPSQLYGAQKKCICLMDTNGLPASGSGITDFVTYWASNSAARVQKTDRPIGFYYTPKVGVPARNTSSQAFSTSSGYNDCFYMNSPWMNTNGGISVMSDFQFWGPVVGFVGPMNVKSYFSVAVTCYWEFKDRR